MIKLIRPTLEYADAIMELRREFLEEDPDEDIHGAGNLRECGNAEEWIHYVEKMRQRETCPKDLVDSDIYLALREEDNLASERTIRGGGGIYEKTVWAEPLKVNMKRFWIRLDNEISSQGENG